MGAKRGVPSKATDLSPFDVLEVRAASYTTAAGDVVACEVRFRGPGWLPFTATRADTVKHAANVWARLDAGEAGAIATYVPPPSPPVRHIVTGAEFVGLFTPTEVAALWGADPRLMAGALKVAAQNSANLTSPEANALLGLAVALGVISPARRDQILAGQPPGP